MPEYVINAYSKPHRSGVRVSHSVRVSDFDRKSAVNQAVDKIAKDSKHPKHRIVIRGASEIKEMIERSNNLLNYVSRLSSSNLEKVIGEK